MARPKHLRRWRLVVTACAGTLLAGLVPLLAPSAQAAVAAPVRVNANGPSFTDSAGRVWSADRAYSGGSWGYDTLFGSGSTTSAIAGTADDTLYQTYNLFNAGTGYKFDVANGTYQVTLKMVEDWATAGGQRRFDVRIEGTVVLSAFDIFASCGKFTACDRTFTASVADGQLNVAFTMNGGANYATVSAIEVTTGTGGGGGGGTDTTPPSAPANLAVTGKTSSSVSLSWTASTDNVGVTAYDVFNGTIRATTVTGTSATVTGLSASTTYTFTVRARDAAGNTSAPSNQVSTTTSASGGGGGGSGHKRVAYFTQWGIYGRDFMVNDVDASGAAAKLTQINYAFGNVSVDGKCFEINQLGQGDAWADYQRRFTAAESVDGVADTFDQPLAGSFNQLKELKKKHPQLKVLMSLGGWTWSRYFSNAALTDASRQAFVASCVDLFLKGNLPKLNGEPQGGPGSGAGVFDGFDIDWEWPGSEGNTGNVIRPEDRRNFTLLLAELRRQLDAYGAQTGQKYLLTAFLPADPRKVDAGVEGGVFQSLDFATVQGYDFHGAWEAMTNHQSALRVPAADPSPPEQEFSVDKAISKYLSLLAPASKLVVGVPAYGRGWTGVGSANNGLYQSSAGPATGTWEAGIEDYKVVKNKAGTRFRDTTNGALWLHDGTNWWSYDDPTLLTQKAEYITAKGLGGSMMWSLDGDDATASLTSALAAGLP
jgi:chitinase